MYPTVCVLIPGYVYNRYSKLFVKQIYLLGSSCVLAQHWRENSTHPQRANVLIGRMVSHEYLFI